MKEKNTRKQNCMGQNKESFLEHWQVIALFLLVYDAIVAGGSYFAALWLRFDCRFDQIPDDFLSAWLQFSPLYMIVSVIVLWVLHLYQSIWRFASFYELERIALASGFLGMFHTLFITILFRRMPITYYVIGIFIQFVFTVLIRFSYRFILLERSKRNAAISKAQISNVMLIGAGSAGQMLLRELHSTRDSKDRVLCIIDDNKNKWGRFVDGVPVVGGRDDIFLNVEKYHIEKIYLAIPGIDPENRRDILNICKNTNCELKNLPSKYKDSGNITAHSVVPVDIEDLLGRATIQADMKEIFEFIEDKVILVTGGGGSIGSELCRQIARHKPKQLIIFDIYENNAHAIGLELKDRYPSLNLEVLIGSVRDSNRLNQVFERFKPELVFHAAAHKHVPLMEDSPCESIKNNAIGTYKTAYAAMMNGCKRFVLISTDKAVNPTNIMGASKRMCEMIIQTFDRKIKEGRAFELNPIRFHRIGTDLKNADVQSKHFDTKFVAVRFGNVLGSNGSVVPRFKEQIAKGGPITVTHPDIIRYFMTIPEAVSLVLQAGTYAEGGEIFVLDMGSPVKIDSLARNLIRLSGLVPDVDIKIEYTGLRAGEKLYEEKLMSEEGLRKTPNQLIHIGSPIQFDTDEFLRKLKDIVGVIYDGREDLVRELVMDIVSTYHPAGKHGSEEKGEEYEKQIGIAEQGDNREDSKD